MDDRNERWYDDIDGAEVERESRRGSRSTGHRGGRSREDPRRRARTDGPRDGRPGLLSGVGDALTRERGSGPGRRGLSDAALARIGATVLWVLVILAAYGGITSWLQSGSSGATAADPASTEDTDGRWAAAGFAERYLAAYLQAGSDGAVLAPYLGYTPDLPAATEPVETTSPLRTVEVRPGDGATDYWSVTLAVGTPDPLASPAPGPEEAGAEGDGAEGDGAEGAGPTEARPGELFWQVAVDTSGARPVAVGLPAPVPPPAQPDRAEDTYTLRLPPQDDPMVESTEGFLAAYLCGAPDLDRYLHPDATGSGGTVSGGAGNEEDDALRPADPPVCESVAIERWATGGIDPGPGGDEAADGARHTVLAEVTFDDGDAARRATYGLTLARRDGRWEVAALLAAPPREER